MPVELTSLALPVAAPLLTSLSAVGVTADEVNRVVEGFQDAHHAQELEQPRTTGGLCWGGKVGLALGSLLVPRATGDAYGVLTPSLGRLW